MQLYYARPSAFAALSCLVFELVGDAEILVPFLSLSIS